MGVVYRARDRRLERDVALKLIPAAHAADSARARRFEQEARTAGQLNHPNIMAVYDIGTHEGAPFIVSELLEGDSLRTRLQGGPIPARKTIGLTRQIAEGLAAAHAKGIVHRDLKPENLFVTADGRLKILDFGVAKLTRATVVDRRGPIAVATETEPGTVVGTAAYMSPEQVRGEDVDARSDIFSLGAILHEMLTGHPAFTRGTSADTMAAILKEDPREPLSDETPGLERIVARCLEKTRDARFQSARDLAFALEVLSGTDENALVAPSGGVFKRGAVTIALAAIALGGLLLVSGVWLNRRAANPPNDNPLAEARFSRFTDWSGGEGGAEISPDGRFVAFKAERDGEIDLFVSQVGTGRFLNLTQDEPTLSFQNIMRTFGFNGDGSEIWFASAGDAGGPKALVPLTGGERRPFLGLSSLAPFWSPDNTQLVYFTNGSGDPLLIADRSGADPKRIAVDNNGLFGPAAVHNHNPVWSPDGQWIYFVHGPQPDSLNVWRVHPSGGTAEQLTNHRATINYVAAIDQHTLLVVARADDGSGPWLWSLDIDRRVTRRVTSGLERYSTVSASQDGRRIVATVSNPTSTLWRVPMPSSGQISEERDVVPFDLPSTRAGGPRFGGSVLFFLSNRGAADGLWRFQNGQSFEVWQRADTAVSEPAAVSPDGTRVAITVRQDGKRRLLMMSADGTDARTLAPAIDIRGTDGQGSADWSPDGKWIVVSGTDAQGPGLFKIPVNDGDPVRLVSGPVLYPIWSPDGNTIVYGDPVVAGQVPLRAVRPDGSRLPLPEVRVRLLGGHRFLRRGTAVVYAPQPVSREFWLLDLEKHSKRQIASFTDPSALRTFDISPDGASIVFERMRENSDIALIELPKK
jgi:serine/threonine protein kinase